MEFIRKIESERNSKLLCYVTSDRRGLEARIAKDALPFIYDHLKIFGKVPKIDLFLHTIGGDTLAGFGIVNKIREFCTEFCVLVTYKALSCGTLISLGADEIVMTETGTLSPIDPEVTSEYNPTAKAGDPQTAGKKLPVNVEDAVAFLDFARKEGKIEDLEDVFLKLAQEVHPLALGRVFRAREQMSMLGEKLLYSHNKKPSSETVERIVRYLSRELGSHDYEISRKEAKRELPTVIDANEKISGLLWGLLGLYRKDMELDRAFNPELILGIKQAVEYKATLAIIESTEKLDYYENEWELRRVQVQKAPGMLSPGVEQRITKSGWNSFT